MIRYPVTLTEIEQRVDTEIPNWRSRARRRTTHLINKGHYEEKTKIWGEVKPIYMDLQYDKCIFCEQRLEGGSRGPIAHDLEHYRPKNAVKVWPEVAGQYNFPTGSASEGYYQLAYHLGNYAAACKACNTIRKSNFFPIAGARVTGKREPADYATEQPFLPYPIGTSDDDPEELIAFVFSKYGPLAVPKYTETQNRNRWQRGRVTIEFLDLNCEDLREDRAYHLIGVWETFKNVQRRDVGSQATLDIYTSPGAAHTNCNRCFVRLWQQMAQSEVELRHLPILQRIVQNSRK